MSFFRNDPSVPSRRPPLFYNDRRASRRWPPGTAGRPASTTSPPSAARITVSLRDAWGEPLDAMHVGDRTYVVGQEGERYSIVIANHTPRRFEAVATVDGLDVINGKAGSFGNRGYVLMPARHASRSTASARASDAVAAFRFAKVRDSYAAQRGEARNVGVIGIAFFAERGDDWDADDLRTRDTASPFPDEGRFAPPPLRIEEPAVFGKGEVVRAGREDLPARVGEPSHSGKVLPRSGEEALLLPGVDASPWPERAPSRVLASLPNSREGHPEARGGLPASRVGHPEGRGGLRVHGRGLRLPGRPSAGGLLRWG